MEVLPDEPDHVRVHPEDAEIVEVVRFLASVTSGRVKLLTGDLNMRVRAGVLGVEVLEVPEDWRLKSFEENEAESPGASR